VNDSIERFKKRMSIVSEKAIHNMPFDDVKPTSKNESDLTSLILTEQVYSTETVSQQAGNLLLEINGKIDQEKLSALIYACEKECLQAIVRPFGIGRVLFDDKEGGNVDTIHNARSSVYATEKEQKIFSERVKYGVKDESGKIINDYHKDPRYIKENAISSADQKNDVLTDSYSDSFIGQKESKNLDHVVSAKEIHDDPGRLLAEINGWDLANQSLNLKATTETINKSKKAKSIDEFIDYTKTTKIPTLKTNIASLEGKEYLTDEDLRNLKKFKADLDKFENLDENKMREADDASRTAIDSKINTQYYRGTKFIGNTARTSAHEGGKMALQQAIGTLMEEFVRAAFFEVKDTWKNGFKSSIDDTFFDSLKLRLMRVADRIQSRWKDAALALRDGFISGFLSNLVTVLINTFKTMSARVVRMAREGFMSLSRALKILAFPPDEISLAQAADAASKLLATGLVTSGGIQLEASFEASLTVLGALAPYVSSIAVGVTTGLCTVFVVYLLDQIDIFGVNAASRHEQVMAKLDSVISESYERTLVAALVFDDKRSYT